MEGEYLGNFPSNSTMSNITTSTSLNYGSLRNKLQVQNSHVSTTNNENENLNLDGDHYQHNSSYANTQSLSVGHGGNGEVQDIGMNPPSGGIYAQQYYDQLIQNHPSTSDSATLNTKPLDLYAQSQKDIIQQQKYISYYTHRFKQGVASIFRQWMALQLAIEHRWGGAYVIDKAEDFLADTIDLFTQRQTRSSSVIDKNELEGFLNEIMTSDFDAVAEDGSIEQIAELILTCYHQCMEESNESLVNDLLRMEMKARKENLRQKYLEESNLLSREARIASGDADIDSDSDSDEDEDGDLDMEDDNNNYQNHQHQRVVDNEEETNEMDEDQGDQAPTLMCLDGDGINVGNTENIVSKEAHTNQQTLNTTNTIEGSLMESTSTSSNYINLQGPSNTSVGLDVGITLGYYENIWNDNEMQEPKKKKQPKSKPQPDEDGWITVGKHKK